MYTLPNIQKLVLNLFVNLRLIGKFIVKFYELCSVQHWLVILVQLITCLSTINMPQIMHGYANFNLGLRIHPCTHLDRMSCHYVACGFHFLGSLRSVCSEVCNAAQPTLAHNLKIINSSCHTRAAFMRDCLI